MKELSVEVLLDSFRSSSRVKNADLLRDFKPYIGHSDPQLRAKYREEFKLIIDQIAVVKTDNDVKYLVLKKKYRLLLQERDSKHLDSDKSRCWSPSREAGTAQWEVPDVDTPPSSSNQRELEEDLCCGEAGSEQDEDSTGSVGSAPVALDPLEKDWIYSAAGARVLNLSQLLHQDPALANKKDFTSGFTALHWAAKHGNQDMASLVVGAGADVNSQSHGGYTPLHIAALHGHQHILDLLLGTYGAKEDLRDYSGRLFCFYLNREEEERENFQVTQSRDRNRNRKLASLFQSRKRWGSAEELAAVEEEEEERAGSHQLLPLPPFRPRKFSR